MTILFTDPMVVEHETGAHPERAARILAITSRLAQADSHLLEACTAGTYTPVDASFVRELHANEVVERIQQLAEQGGGRVDADTVVSPKSYEIALAVAGICTAAVDAVLAGDDSNAFCLIRPPGHHATPTRSMGFCLFNNIALAAHHARTRHELDRILIVDWDVHHGNGTQDMFYDDDGVYFYSAHRYDGGRFYPGTGDADDTGTGNGLGWTRNLTFDFGISREEYLAGFRTGLEQAVQKCKPELILLSAGFDAHAEDPIGSLGLEAEDFATMTKMVLEVSKTHAAGRIVSCLEGGYNLERLAECVEAHLRELTADG